ncbi:MAG: 7-carboxy-7-deazaguanine synthase QueE [Thermotogae bacterium]|nr:7-carboxy-7-deazaguanine synthase QueE [Thermotogota bacterium]
MEDRIPLSERFYSIQGEGPLMGTPALFLRVMGCNLRCVWCDTPYTWDRWGISRYGKGEVSRSTDYRFQDFVRDVRRYRLVVLTGGEPMLYSGVWERWIGEVDGDTVFQFETNGTFAPILEEDGRVLFVVSPKFPESGNPDAIRIDILRRYMPLVEEGRAFLKFVISSPRRDEERIRELVERLNFPRSRLPFQLFVMPEGTSLKPSLVRATVDMALRNGWRYSDRLHLRVWGNRRGR